MPSGGGSSAEVVPEADRETGSSGSTVSPPRLTRRQKRTALETANVVEVMERFEQRRYELSKMQMERDDRLWEQERRDRAERDAEARKERAAEQERREQREAKARAERVALVRLMESLTNKLAEEKRFLLLSILH